MISEGNGAGFSWRSREIDSFVCLSLRGELDYHTVRMAGASLPDGPARPPWTLMLDMRELSFIDSSGLGFLIRARRHIDSHGGRLVVTRVSPMVQRVVNATRLNSWFDPVHGLPPDLMWCPLCEEVIRRGVETCDWCRSAV